MDVNQTVGAGAGVVTIVAAIAVATRAIVRAIRRLGERWEAVQSDLYGEPARPGREAVPGALDRIKEHNTQIVTLSRRMDDHLVTGHSIVNVHQPYPGGTP